MGCPGSASNFFDHNRPHRNALVQTGRTIPVCPARAVGGRILLTSSAGGDQTSQHAAPVTAIGGKSARGLGMAITKARAEHIGSPGYIWRTSKDGAVRPSHRKMEGKLVPWDKPPTLDNYTAHCGEFANCRCFPEPIIPDRFGTN